MTLQFTSEPRSSTRRCFLSFLHRFSVPGLGLLAAMLLGGTQTLGADGWVLFDNRVPELGVNAPIFAINGTTLLTGTSYRAQLYCGSTPSSLVPTGQPLFFGTGGRAGFFELTGDTEQGRREVPVAPGQLVYVQVRAWATEAGGSFEAAVGQHGAAGLSTIFPVYAGDESQPAVLLGLDSFKVITGVRGQVNFSNIGTGVSGTLYDLDGTTTLEGDQFRVQLLAGASPADLQPAGPVVANLLKGRFNAGSVDLPGIASGSAAYFQIRVWHVADGETFEAASAAGGRAGASNIGRVFTRYIDPFSPPPIPTGLIGLLPTTLVAGVPVIRQEPRWLLLEDSPASFELGVHDADSPVEELKLAATSDTPSLILPGTLGIAQDGARHRLSFALAPNASGQGSISVVVADLQGLRATNVFSVLVLPVNDPPELVLPNPPSSLEDGGTVAVTVSLTDPETTAPKLTLRVLSSNLALIPPEAIALEGTGTSRVLTYRSAPNASGTATLSLTATDPQGAATTRDLLVTVLPVNDPPTLVPLGELLSDEDQAAPPIPLNIGDVDDALASLTVGFTSTNPELLPPGSLELLSQNGAWSLRIRPAQNRNGNATITVTVTDPALAAIQQPLTLTVRPVNDPPEITGPSEVTLSEDQARVTLPITLSDVDDPSAQLEVQAFSTDIALVPAANIALEGAGPDRTLSFRPAPDANGQSTLRLVVRDPQGATAELAIAVLVTPVNDPPTLSSLAPLTLEGTDPSDPIPFEVRDLDNPAQELIVRVESSDPELLPPANIHVDGTAEQRNLVVQPAANRDGDVTLTLSVSDGVATVQTELLVTVHASYTIAGVAQDGYVAHATVFLDLNGNQIPDAGEPTAHTDAQGSFSLPVSLTRYDRNRDGHLGPDEGRLVVLGGHDIATGLGLKAPLTAPPEATVVNPLTTLVTALMDRDPALDVATAAAQVKLALDLPASVPLMTFDPLAAAADADPDAAGVLAAAALVHDSLVQVASLVTGATPGTDASAIQRNVLATFASQVDHAGALSLADAPSLRTLIREAAAMTDTPLPEAVIEGAAALVAAGNELKQDLADNLGDPLEAAREISRVQIVAQSTVSDALAEVAAGQTSVDDALERHSGARLEEQIAAAPVASVLAPTPEPGTFAFGQARFEVLENGAALTAVTVNRTAGTQGSVTVLLQVTDGTATRSGSDYHLDQLSVTFADGEIRKTVSLAGVLTDDAEPEDTETLELSLQLGDDAPAGASVGALSTAQLTIRDNDRAGTFSFTAAQYEVWENGSPVHEITIERRDGASGDVAVIVTPSDFRFGARHNLDYIPDPVPVTFLAGNLQRRVRIPILQDSFGEPTEPLKLTLTLAAGSPPAAALGSLQLATLSIRDDDALTRPRLHPTPVLVGGRLQFRVEGDRALRYALETSADLSHWTRLGVYSLDADQNLPPVTAAAGPGPGLFYRIVQVTD